MPNLMPPAWAAVDPAELRFILMEIIGGPGQFDNRAGNPDVFHLPLARQHCCVTVTFSDKRIVAIEPGPAFDATKWAQVVSEIDNGRPPVVGRDCSFSGYRVDGSWRGAHSGIQILPPPAGAPVAPFEMADHPFLLEFPVIAGDVWPITNFRRMREHRRLSLLLNVLLKGGITTQPQRGRHLWAVPANGQLEEAMWVQEFYYANFGNAVQDHLSPAAAAAIEEIAPDTYYAMIGQDGRSLRVPADLDESICSFLALSKTERDAFGRASFWMDTASRVFAISTSASFASLVIAIEALGERNKGATARFRDFINRHARGASLEKRNKMYELRSDIIHGTGLMESDKAAHFSWAPPEQDERDLMDELSTLARVAIRHWLKNPAERR
jgi:hypothetical protein